MNFSKMKYLELLTCIISFCCFQALGTVTIFVVLLDLMDFFFFYSSHYLISQQYRTRLLTWLYMPSFLKHSSSLASVTHCSLIFPPTLAALSWYPT